MNLKTLLVGAAVLTMMADASSAATLSGVGTYEGVAGIGTSNGDVGDSALGSDYLYLTTEGSSYYGGGLGLGNEYNGTTFTTNSFSATAGLSLDLLFNYVTSDGASFADYAFVLLNDLVSHTSITLFTARTTTSGDTVPGFGMPPIDPNVTLIPTSTPIIAGAPTWSELGSTSGQCYDVGCGSTGWIEAYYFFQSSSTFNMTFGVVNWDDDQWSSGLAIADVKVGDDIIVDPSTVPLPAGGVLVVLGLGVLSLLRRRKSV